MINVIYINIFQYLYNIVKNNSITNLLNTNKLSSNPTERVSILSYFYSIIYKNELLSTLDTKFSGYTIKQSIIDKYTFAILRDNIVVIDYDSKEMTLDKIKNELDKHPFVYDIVKSIGGYHIFITSRYLHLKNINTLNLMSSFRGSDPLFAFFTYLLGTTNIRMCKKESEDPNKPIYTFIETYKSKKAKEKGIHAKPEIHRVVENHIKEAEEFKNIIVKEKENSRTLNLERKFTELENLPESLLDTKLAYAKISYNISKSDLKTINLEKLKHPTHLVYHFVPFHIY